MGSFDVQLNTDQLIWVGLIMGVVQSLKDIPMLAFLRDWLPLVILLMAEGVAFSMNWANPIPAGLVLGLTTLGTYKAATTTSTAVANRRASGGIAKPNIPVPPATDHLVETPAESPKEGT